jgi:hypothetical protein
MSVAHSDWLNPLEKMTVRTAVSKREKEVTLRNGTKIMFDYDRRPGMIWFKVEGHVAPCGWWSL